MLSGISGKWCGGAILMMVAIIIISVVVGQPIRCGGVGLMHASLGITYLSGCAWREHTTQAHNDMDVLSMRLDPTQW